MVTDQGNNNDNTASTLDQTNGDATNNTAGSNPRTRRLAELEAAGIEFSTYLYLEIPKHVHRGSPSVKIVVDWCLYGIGTS